MLSAPPARTRSAAPVWTMHAGLDHRLKAGAAAAVDLEARHVNRQAGVERGHAPDRGRFAVGVALAEQHVVDRFVRQSGALEHPFDHGAGQLDGRDIPEHAAEAAHRRSQRLADHGVSHRPRTVSVVPVRTLANSMPSKRAARMVERVTRRIPGLRVIPVVKLLAAAEIILIAREHIERLEPYERRRIVELLRIGYGRPRNLSPAEREELQELVAKAEPRLFAGLVAEQLSPVGLPRRIVQGRKRR